MYGSTTLTGVTTLNNNLSVAGTTTLTGWNSLYLQLDSLYNMRDQVTRLCEGKIDNLQIDTWTKVGLYIKLYKPFNDMTNELSKEMETTSSKVLPLSLDLRPAESFILNI